MERRRGRRGRDRWEGREGAHGRQKKTSDELVHRRGSVGAGGPLVHRVTNVDLHTCAGKHIYDKPIAVESIIMTD